MLIFLHNELQQKDVQTSLKLPLTFIKFAHVEGKMYSHFRKDSSFITPVSTRTWGNGVAYGSIWHIEDWSFYSRILDAYHSCSLSSVSTNHRLDIHHRLLANATPIHFDSLGDFSRLKYREGTSVQVQLYVGNPNHPKIKQRLRQKAHSYRIIDGIDVPSFKAVYREEQRGI